LTQQLAERPPQRLGIPRATYLVVDLGLFALLVALGVFLARTHVVLQEPLPRHFVLWMLDRTLARQLAGPMPDEETRVDSRGRVSRGGIGVSSPVEAQLGHEQTAGHEVSQLFRGVSDGTVVELIMHNADANGRLCCDYGNVPALDRSRRGGILPEE